MESLANGTGTGVEFLDHAFNALAKTGLVQIDCKDVLAAVKFLEAGVILIRLTDFKRSNNGLNLCKQRIG